MKALNFTRPIQIYYVLSLLIVISGMSYAGYYYWSSGLLNGNAISSLYESSVWIDDIQKNDFNEKIRQDIEMSRVRNALSTFEVMNTKISDINRVIEKPEFEKLDESMKKLKRQFNKLITYPEISSMLDVFQGRMDKFQSFVIKNGWRTLTRMSRRINERLNIGSNQSYAKLTSLNNRVTQDLVIMRNITLSSVLSQTDKNLIVARLTTLQTEMLMLEKYLTQLKIFQDMQKDFQKNYYGWIEKIAPELSLTKIEITKKNKQFFSILVGTVMGTVLLLLAGFLISARNSRKNLVKLEKFLVDYSQNAIVPVDPKDVPELSENFRNEFYKVHSYIQKRMSFGQIFQDTLPFSSILLDSNLRVVWCNTNFCDLWNLEKNTVDEGNMSWDYIIKFTNLVDNDPVVDAMQNGMAGIFQIKAKVGANSPTVPLEMYVSPTESNGIKRVMIYFYPLSSMEETINNQTQATVGPINKALNALRERTFEDSYEELQDEFNKANIDHVYDHFQALSQILNEREKELCTEVISRDEQIENKDLVFNELVPLIEKLMVSHQNIKKQVLATKNSIISLFDMNSNSLKNSKSIITNSENAISEGHKLMDTVNEMASKFDGTYQSFETIIAAKKNIHFLISSINDEKMKIQQIVDQVSVVQRSKRIDEEAIDLAIGKLKGEVRNIDRILSDLNKEVRTVDIASSKIELLLDGDALEEVFSSLGNSKEDLENKTALLRSLSQQYNEILQQGHFFEDQIINELKALMETINGDSKTLGTIQNKAICYDLPPLPTTSRGVDSVV